MLVRNLWLSFDPGQRTWLLRDAYVPVIQIGEVMQACAIGEVAESRQLTQPWRRDDAHRISSAASLFI